MKLVSRLSLEHSREYQTTGIILDEWLENIEFVAPNAADLVWGKQSEGLFHIEADKKEFRHVSPAADAKGDSSLEIARNFQGQGSRDPG